MRTRIPAIARKETLHILRDRRTLLMAFVFPLVLLVLFGYAVTFDIKHIRLAVADDDKTPASRELISRLTSSGYFRVAAYTDDPGELPGILDRGEARIALVIPVNYGERLSRAEAQHLQVLYDGSDNNTATIASGYMDAVFTGLNIELLGPRLKSAGRSLPPVEGRPRIRFNPELESTYTIVTGLIGLIMMVISALLTSLTIVREREQGSLEGLCATPVRKYELLTGKLIPYFMIAMIDCLLVAGAGVFIFHVPFLGSLLLFLLVTGVFSFAGLSVGLLASIVSTSQLLALQIVILTTLLPSFLLSGFMFPVSSMPGWVQAITYAVPARYFIRMCRGIMLQGQNLRHVATPLAFLCGFCAVLFMLSVLRFSKKV